MPVGHPLGGPWWYRVTEDASLQDVDVDITGLDMAAANDYDCICLVGDIFVSNKAAGTVTIGFSSDSAFAGYGEIRIESRRAIHGRDNIT